jgi:pimeloyl-ACP methyl ester carboxylesterase
MAFFEHAAARMYYESVGRGEAIITTHGLSENGTYWSLPGVTDALARDYCVVSLDARGHGRSSIDLSRPGFDVETMAGDIGALADHLGLERFHLLAHATGGMTAVHYARTHHRRLRSLMLTDTGPATSPVADRALISQVRESIAKHFEGKSWDDIMAVYHAAPEPFFDRIDSNPWPTKCWAIIEATMRFGDPNVMAAFCRTFYADPDPHVDELRKVSCPTSSSRAS